MQQLLKFFRPIALCLFVCIGVVLARPAHADAPAFASNALTVNKSTTYLLDAVLYTIKLDNTAGTADALDVVLTDHLPWGMEVQLFSVDGVPQLLSLLTDGAYIGTIPAGTSKTVTIYGAITNIPIRPMPASYTNQASWTYRYRPSPGAPKVNASFTTNSVVTNMVRLESSMAIANVALAPLLNLGTEMTFTIAVTNTGTLNSSGTTLLNLIPVGALYVAGSTKMNGVTLPDIAIAGPFVLGGNINSPGRPAGQINIGETATITFKATALILPAINLAVIDADGPGPTLPLNLRGYPEGASADLGVTMTDGVTSLSPGNDVTYSVVVRNNGTATVDSLTLIDNLPATLINPTYTASTGTYNSSNGEWTGLTLATNQTITLTVKAKVSTFALTNIVNSVTVYPPSGVTDSVSGNNTATDTNTLSLVADLGVIQFDGVTSVTPAMAHQYTITVTNSGPSIVSNFNLTDTVPSTLLTPVFTPDEGSYNSTTKVWSGLNMAPGESVKMTLSGTISGAATGTIINTVTVSPSAGLLDLNATNNTSVDTNTVVPAASVSGTVYLDANHSSNLDAAESGTGLNNLYVKLVPVLGLVASQATPVNTTTGVYNFTSVLPGIYNLVLDDNGVLTDITAALPAGYLGTEAPTQRRENLTVNLGNSPGQNFGLWHGSKLSGSIWNDNGAGLAIANDGVQSVTEAGISGAGVTLYSGATNLDTTTTDGSGSFTIWLPFGAANPLRAVATMPANFVGVAGRVGTTAGTYDRATSSVSFNPTAGTVYTGVGFAGVAVNTLTAGSSQNGNAGGVFFFPHTFTAGTKGTVTFSGTQVNSPANPAWNGLIYRDLNGNGAIDLLDTQITTPINVVANQQVAVIVRMAVPAGAMQGAQSQFVLKADFLYDGVTPALSSALTATDSGAVGTSPSLILVQSVDKTNAKTGEIITYTITYRNGGNTPLNGVGIRNTTPAFTSFVGAAYGALPANLTNCTILKPAIGAAGSIAWDFAGTLAPGASGTVSFQVLIQ